MADQDLRAAMRPSRWRIGALSFDFSHIAGAVLAVVLVGGAATWLANLVSRDVSGVPVVLALNGVAPSPDAIRVAQAPETERDVTSEERALAAALEQNTDIGLALEGAAFTSADRLAASAPVAPSRIEAPAPLDLSRVTIAPEDSPEAAAAAPAPEALQPEESFGGKAVAVSPRPVRRPSSAAQPAPSMMSEEDRTRRAILDALQGQANLEVMDEGDELPLTNIAFTNADPEDAPRPQRPALVQADPSSFRILPAVATTQEDAVELALASDASAQHAGPADLVCIPKDVVESY